MNNSRVLTWGTYAIGFLTMLMSDLASNLSAQQVLINEFMAGNRDALVDEDGDTSDWIELYNPGKTPIDLFGWYLTDDPDALNRWSFPALTLSPGGFVVVFASGKDRVDPELHTSFKLDAGGEFLALVRDDGSTVEHAFAPNYPPQKTDYSYGLVRSSDGGQTSWDELFFETPTPGKANIAGFAGFVADTKFSVDRGFYSKPFQCIITTETDGAEIRFTTDFSEPTETRGTVYSQPIAVTTTTIIRAAAFKPGLRPTNVDTHTYIFIEDVVRQPPMQTGWPSTWRDGNGTVPADYEMDPEITEDPLYSAEMVQALTDIPSISVVTEMGNLFGNTTGIYDNPKQSGVNWERPASVEWILPDNSPGFQINAGLRIQGGASREPQKSPKHSFRLLFKNQYGPSKLRYKLFPEKTATESFDTLILRAGFNQSWIHHNNFLGDNRGRAQYVRDQWAKDTQLAMGPAAAHNNYAHLYLNGLYWGLYNPTERPSDSFAATYFGGDKSEYDVINSGEAVDGNLIAWNQMFNLANSGMAEPEKYLAMTEILDVEAFIDFMIINHYGGNMDWDSHNWYAFRRRDQEGKFYFFMWDSEFIFINSNDNRINLNDDKRPSRLFTRLKENQEFRIKVADHIHKHFFNVGLLTPQQVIERWQKRSNTIQHAIIGESARWGDYRRDVLRSGGPFDLLTRDNQWMQESGRLLGDYFPRRTGIVLDQYQSQGWYPDIDAPVFNLPSGRMDSGTPLSMTSQTGVIYYTTDGSDPRQAQMDSEDRTVFVEESSPKTWFIPQSTEQTPTLSAWTGGDEPFDESAWGQGNGGIGYDTAPDYLPFIQTNVEGEMRGQNTSIYIRIPFMTTNPGPLSVLTLKIRYDDGFVAYLNGSRIADANAPGNLSWNSRASSSHSDSAAVQLQSFDVSDSLPLLKQGTNILAIQGLNQSLTSSDFLISASLEASLQPDVEISPKAEIYSEPIELIDTSVVNARVLVGNQWSALNSVVYAVGTDLFQLTELHYHPTAPSEAEIAAGFLNQDSFEFIEFHNRGDQPIDLTGIRLTEGVEFDFSQAVISHIQPGETVVLVSDLAAFEFRYGKQLPVAGEFRGNLANDGERLAAVDITGKSLFDFGYLDTAPWPEEADGQGPSMELIPERFDVGEAANWRTSRVMHGTPGTIASESVRIDSIEIKDRQLRLIFQGPPQIHYQIFVTEEFPNGDWVLVASGVFNSTDMKAQFTEDIPEQMGQRFYRISTQ